MEDKDCENSYTIPANYTDSGKILGGMIAPRHAIEAIIITLAVGYLEYLLLPALGAVRVIVMVVTLLPLGIVAIMGIDGDSLFQFFSHVVRFLKRRRKIHFKKIEGEHVDERKT